LQGSPGRDGNQGLFTLKCCKIKIKTFHLIVGLQGIAGNVGPRGQSGGEGKPGPQGNAGFELCHYSQVLRF
jgi:hypothetical protein